MSKQKEIDELKKEAEQVLSYLKELSEKRSGNMSERFKELYDENLAKGNKLLDQIEKLQKEERGNQDMKKMETRTMGNFETELRNLSTTSNATALIPENVQGEIIKTMEEVSPAFQHARKLPSVNGTLKVARENDGVQAGFFGEGEEILESSINFKHVELKQKRLGAAVSLSNQLMNDSAVDIVAYVNELLGRRVGKTAEHAIFNGDGDKQFSGVIGDTEVKSKEISGAVSVDGLLDLYTELHPAFLEDAAFYMSRSFFNKVVKLKDENGHFYMQNGIVNGKPTYTLFGRPVFVTEALDAGEAAGETPAVFANMKQAYSILVKKEMSIKQIIDGPNALRGSQLLVLDGYMDGAVTNPQAAIKLVVTSA
ncbi:MULTISPECIES: phage major capsid protein [unclassified Cytobacillus]|uniref:phage major capsid protein n=1 Tax=unclassified Cytobacillus TaxID=2675268 RepID=UPI00203E07F5|nr:phage major capsid protein [Cytobacillus sp. AMY 15.2]MCM3093861.1 phage major capsid protein [Cytobacillus sp. AMY 15.2]